MNAACVAVLERAPMPPTVWNIPVACLLANAMRAPGFFNPKGAALCCARCGAFTDRPLKRCERCR